MPRTPVKSSSNERVPLPFSSSNRKSFDLLLKLLLLKLLHGRVPPPFSSSSRKSFDLCRHPSIQGIIDASKILPRHFLLPQGNPSDMHACARAHARVYACLCACVRAFVRACVRACVRASVRACVRASVLACVCAHAWLFTLAHVRAGRPVVAARCCRS